MDRVRCAKCGAEHDLRDVEPSYGRPDAYFEVPSEERAQRASFGKDDGRIRDADDAERRHFLRALLPIRVRGEEDEVSWGVWVEVGGWEWNRAQQLWDDSEQSAEPPFPGTLANELKGYEGTRGLPGSVQLTGATTAPRFLLAEDLDHPLASEQREGVFLERALEWIALHAH